MCRTANGADMNFEKCYKENIKSVIENGLIKYDIQSAAQKDGRGNICPVTIILPTLAMQAKEPDKFLKLLDRKIEEAKDMLLERYNLICSQPPSAAKFMWENHTMVGYREEEGVKSAIKHGTLAIGQLGLAETLQILLGTDQTTEEGMKLAKEIEQMFKDKCDKFKKQSIQITPSVDNVMQRIIEKLKSKNIDITPNDMQEIKKYCTQHIH